MFTQQWFCHISIINVIWSIRLFCRKNKNDSQPQTRFIFHVTTSYRIQKHFANSRAFRCLAINLVAFECKEMQIFFSICSHFPGDWLLLIIHTIKCCMSHKYELSADNYRGTVTNDAPSTQPNMILCYDLDCGDRITDNIR